MFLSLARRGIIHRYVPIRSPFDKTNYIDNYIPPLKTRKPRQAKWDDPSYEWPPKMPTYTEFQNKALVSEVEKEYLENLKAEKKHPEIKTGDIVEVTTFQSMSGKQISVFKGICIGIRRAGTLNSSINVYGAVDGVHMEMHIKLYSPMVKEIKIIEFGTGNFRKRLNYFRELPITTYKALKKGINHREKPTSIAKKEEQAMRYKILKGEIYEDEVETEAPKPTEAN
jgi:ribosomal protein L19